MGISKNKEEVVNISVYNISYRFDARVETDIMPLDVTFD